MYTCLNLFTISLTFFFYYFSPSVLSTEGSPDHLSKAYKKSPKNTSSKHKVAPARGVNRKLSGKRKDDDVASGVSDAKAFSHSLTGRSGKRGDHKNKPKESSKKSFLKSIVAHTARRII